MESARRIGTDAPAAGARRPGRGLRLLILGFALSLPLHAAVVAWLAVTFIDRPGVPETAARPIEIVSLPGDGDAAAPDAGRTAAEPSPAGGPAADPLLVEPSPPGPGGDPSLLGSAAGSSDGLGEFAALPGDGFGGGAGGGGGGGGFAGGAGGTSFFGVGGRGTRFAFIVDKSGSMLGDRIAAAKEELVRAVAALPDYAAVHVAFFDAGEPTAFGEGWQRIRGGSMQRFRSWLRNVSASGDTQPAGAFRQAFALEPRPDVIFFLTDGRIPEECLEQVRGLNSRGKRVQVNTIAFDDPSGGSQLRQIAQESAGQFREVRIRPADAVTRPAGGGR